MTDVQALKDAVDDHGEVHAILPEELTDKYSREIDIRQGQVEWDQYEDTANDAYFTLTSHGEQYPFPYDAIIHFYKPKDI